MSDENKIQNHNVRHYDGAEIKVSVEEAKELAELAGLIEIEDKFGQIHYVKPSNISSITPPPIF